MAKEDIPVDGKIIHVPHLGVTLRTLLSVAAQAWLKTPTGSRYYKLKHNGVNIGEVSIRNTDEIQPTKFDAHKAR